VPSGAHNGLTSHALEQRAEGKLIAPAHADALTRRTPDTTLTELNQRSDFTYHTPSTIFAARQEPAGTGSSENNTCSCNKEEHLPIGEKVGFGVLMPMLVLLSGLFAGLTLGYMSLDETQLQVLAAQGTPKQRADATKITSVTKDRHLLLTTLLIANMITNETLPVIADPLLGGGVQAVIVSTVLVIIFAELIPQSVCARYGLVVGAAMVWPTRIIIFVLYPIAWPVSRILHWLLGAHSGIVYRRAELKELVTMHAAENGKGGDLKGDTIMIVGGALDLQEKVVKDAMTPIDKVFMLPYSAKLDYATLEQIVRSGHSRIPIYQEFDVPVAVHSGTATPTKKPSLLSTFTRKATLGNSRSSSATDLTAKIGNTNSPKLGSAEEKPTTAAAGNTAGTAFETVKRKKILGTLLVKSCVLLDPEDATPLSDMVINAIPTVPGDEPLLNVLNVFQEGRSHMAIVSSRSRRIQNDSVADVGSKASMFQSAQAGAPCTDGLSDIDEEQQLEVTNSKADGSMLAEVKSQEAIEFEESFAGPDSPIGVITLEDVLEELIGEEIWDEYDTVNGRPADFARLSPPPSPDSKGRDPDLQLTDGAGSHSPVSLEDMKKSPVDGAAEKAVAEDEPTVVHNEQAAQQEAAVGANPPKTVLQRLGLGRARSVREGGSLGSNVGDISGAWSEKSNNISSVAAIDGPANSGSKTALPVGTVQHAPGLTPNASSPGTPVLGPAAGSSVRPVVVRSTTASGQTSTATALLPETLLRGRRGGNRGTEPLPPGSIVQLGPSSARQVSGSAEGAGTPLLSPSPLIGSSVTSLGGSSGTEGASVRASRFKSTPVPRPAGRARSTGPGVSSPLTKDGGEASNSGGGGGLDSSIVSLSALPASSSSNAAEQQQQQQSSTLVASPAAIELEVAPLDASIASLRSLGGGPRTAKDSDERK